MLSALEVGRQEQEDDDDQERTKFQYIGGGNKKQAAVNRVVDYVQEQLHVLD